MSVRRWFKREKADIVWVATWLGAVVAMAVLLLALAVQHRAHQPLLAVAVGVGIVALLAWAVVRVRGSRP